MLSIYIFFSDLIQSDMEHISFAIRWDKVKDALTELINLVGVKTNLYNLIYYVSFPDITVMTTFILPSTIPLNKLNMLTVNTTTHYADLKTRDILYKVGFVFVWIWQCVALLMINLMLWHC